MQSVLLRAILHTNGDPVHIDSSRARRTQRARLGPQGPFSCPDPNRIHVPPAEIIDAQPRLVAVLDEIRDPGNAGTIIRAADATGSDGVIFTGRHVDAYNPKVVRSTTGSLFHLPVAQNGPLEDALGALRSAGIQIIAADVKGAPLPRVRHLLPAPTAWLFGNEAHGLGDDALSLADRVVRLPIYGHAESLNLATAASVCLYESAFAQRG